MTTYELEEKVSSLESQLNDLRERTKKAVAYVGYYTHDPEDECDKCFATQEFRDRFMSGYKTSNTPSMNEIL